MTQKETAFRLRSITLAFQGLVIGVFFVFIALASLDMALFKTGFMFLPVAALYLWPPKASYTWSLMCIFLLGLFYDLASHGPLGLWALCYLILFIFLGGGVRQGIGFWAAFAGFLFSVIFVCILALFLARIALGQWPDFAGLGKNIIATLMLFPLIYWLRGFGLLLLGQLGDQKALE